MFSNVVLMKDKYNTITVNMYSNMNSDIIVDDDDDDDDIVVVHENSDSQLSLEYYRLETFNTYDKKCSFLFPHLAKAGFYFDYLKRNIICFDCAFIFNNNGKLTNYQDIINHHAENSPNCLFIKERRKVDQIKRRKTFDDPYKSLQYEKERLATFIEWPFYSSFSLSPEKLAADGFFYFRNSDGCVCIFCNGGIEEWVASEDTPRNQHQFHFPHCPFLRGEPVGNITLAESHILDKLPVAGQGQPTPMEEENNRVISGVHQHLAKFEDFVSEPTRLKSFENKWPNRVCYITPQDLASAGFFYNGPSDHVRCYHCGHGVCNWEMGDNPLEIHARLYPTCGFVLGKEIYSEIKMERRRLKRKRKNENKYLLSAAAKKIKKNNAETITQRFHSLSYNDLNQLLRTSDILRYVQGMGYPRYAIEVAVTQRLEKTGLPFFSVEECVKSVKERQIEIVTDAKIESKQEKVIPQGVILEKHLSLINNSSSSSSSSSLENEKYLCKICMDAKIEIVILPCGHMCCCRSCIHFLKNCPICRNKISFIVIPNIC